MTFNPKDHYFKKAKAQGFKARSAFKLEEIQEKFKIIRKGDQVLDLGCAPGSWSQWVARELGGKGLIVGIDLKPTDLKLPNTIFVQGDIFETNMQEVTDGQLRDGKFDVVLSDMAPKTTGIKLTDQARSHELCEVALDIAQSWLRPGGHVVLKLFHSEDFKTLKERISKEYSRFEALKPQSTRSMSKEIFLVGLNKRK